MRRERLSLCKNTYTLLEYEEVVLGERVRLCNDRDEVDAGAETLHDLDVKGFETSMRMKTSPEEKER
jgi:hypothetical protein